MCGIVGYTGTLQAKGVLLEGLKRLEYRGYDSAGIAVEDGRGINVVKRLGKVSGLADAIQDDMCQGTCGIGHTRWATHGAPSERNAHPHTDCTNKIAVVHNGIIENFAELREELIAKGHTFTSDTDTECIAHLVEENYHGDLFEAVRVVSNSLSGAYGLAVMHHDHPGEIVVTRKDSPIVLGVGENGSYLGSDIIALIDATRDVVILEDNQLAVMHSDHIDYFDADGNPVTPEITHVDWDIDVAEKGGYPDFMLKEIYEQPNAIRETIGSKLSESKISFNDFEISKEFLETINRIYVVACGTAMNAGLATKATFENFCKIPTEVDIASEFRYRDPLIDEHTLCIYISQSGETADTIAALKLAKSKGAKTIALANVIGSSITREADYCIYTHAGPEIAVASTKAYTSQVVLLNILALYFAEVLDRVPSSTIDSMKKNLLELPKKAEITLRNVAEVKNFANIVYKETDMFFLGRGVDYYVASEGSLKLKEISYIHSESYAAGELKHGPIALIENDVTVIGIITNPNLVEKTISNIQEVITRGAKTLVITNQKINESQFFKVINIPDTEPCLSPVLSIIPLQLLSYYISKEKGLDVDKPRNLAKSVTVEQGFQ